MKNYNIFKQIFKYGCISAIFIWSILYIGANAKYKLDKVDDNIVDSRELVHDKRGEGIEFGKFHQLGRIHSAEYIDANFDLYDKQLAQIYTKDQINALAADLITNVLVFTSFDFSSKTNSSGEAYTSQMYYDEIIDWLQNRYDYKNDSFTNTATDIVIEWPDSEDPPIIPVSTGNYYQATCKWDNDTGWIKFFKPFNYHTVADTTTQIGYNSVNNPTYLGDNDAHNRILIRRIGDIVFLQVNMYSYIPRRGFNVIFSVPYGFRPIDTVYGSGTSIYNYEVENGGSIVPMQISRSANQNYTPLSVRFDAGVKNAHIDGQTRNWPTKSGTSSSLNELEAANNSDVKEKYWQLQASFIYLTKDEWVKSDQVDTRPAPESPFVPTMIPITFKTGNSANQTKRPGEKTAINKIVQVPAGSLYTIPTPTSLGFGKLYDAAEPCGWTTNPDPTHPANSTIQYEPGKSYIINMNSLVLYPVYKQTLIKFEKDFKFKFGDSKKDDAKTLVTKKDGKVKSFVSDSYSVEISNRIKTALQNKSYDRETITLRINAKGNCVQKTEFSMYLKLINKNRVLYTKQVYFKPENTTISPDIEKSKVEFIPGTTLSFSARLDYPKDKYKTKEARAAGTFHPIGVIVY